MAEDLKFDELPESKDATYVKTAGVHVGFKVIGAEFTDPKPPKKEGGKATGANIKVTFKRDDGLQFIGYVFSPPANEEEVKFCGDLYEGGVKIRKRTPQEQIKAEFNERFYFFEQLGKAWGADKAKIDNFKKQVSGSPEGLFKKMFEVFFNIFPKDSYKDKRVNFKIAWANNDTQKTSFLGFAKPASNNVIFAMYVNDTTPVLQMSNYEEEKCSERKYKPQDRAPKGDGAEGGEWKPIETANEGGAPGENKADLF